MSEQPARVRIGLIGCGPAGAQAMYAPILRFLEIGMVTAICDPDPRALDFMSAHYGPFDAYADVETMLHEADIDAVLIASPVFLHAEQAAAATRAHRHVLCEKPLAATIEDCDSMAAMAAANDIKIMPAHVRRFDKSIEFATDYVRSGKLGRIFHVHAETSWCHDLSPLGRNWRQLRRTLGGIFQDNGCHAIDLCRLWSGEVVSVSGEARLLREDWEVETAAWATLRHEGGAVSTLVMSNMSQQPMTERYLLEGTQGSLEVAFGPAARYSSPEPFTMTLWEGGRRATDLTLYNASNVDDERQQHGMYKRQIDAFCTALRDGTEPPVSLADGRATIEVINAFYLAVAEGRTVALPLAGSGNLAGAFDAIAGLWH